MMRVVAAFLTQLLVLTALDPASVDAALSPRRKLHGDPPKATTRASSSTVAAFRRFRNKRELQMCRVSGKMCNTLSPCCDGLVCKKGGSGRRLMAITKGTMVMPGKMSGGSRTCVTDTRKTCHAVDKKCGKQLPGRNGKLPCCGDDTVCDETFADPPRCIVPPGKVELDKQPLPSFSKSVLTGYSSQAEFETDLTNAALEIVEQVCNGNDEDGQFGFWYDPFEDEDTAHSQPQARSAPAVGPDVDDFGTANQEAGVEEGDLVVSDGTYVYAGYGDQLAIWNARTGDFIASVEMPAIESGDFRGQRRKEQRKGAAPRWWGGDDGESSWLNSSLWGGGAWNITTNSSWWWYHNHSWWYHNDTWGFYDNKAHIRHLVLDQNSLLVVVDGYEDAMRERNGYTNETAAGLFGYMGTHLRLYETSATGDVTLIKTTNVHGNFNKVRLVDGLAHVMTVSYVNTWEYLVMPFHHLYYTLMMDHTGKTSSYDGYVSYCKDESAAAVDAFVKQVVDELTVSGSLKLPDLVRINSWQENQAKDTSIADMLDQRFEVLNTLALIHTVDMQPNGERNEISVSSAGSFVPGYWAGFYGNTDTLIIACQSWNFLPSSWRTISTTYLIGLSMDKSTASTALESVGHVDGYFRSRYDIDVVDNVLRIATSLDRGYNLLASGTDSAITNDNYNYTQVTESIIVVLDMKDASGTMKELSRLSLGNSTDGISAMRFFPNVAYAFTSTFGDGGSSFVVDFSNPTQPTLAGKLDAKGFTGYLHPMNDDATLLLAVGVESYSSSLDWSLGIQISVFDASTPTDPKLVQSYLADAGGDSTYSYSYSPIEYDFNSGRYNRESQRLIIPVESFGGKPKDDYRGFKTFYVTDTTIVEECRIEHGADANLQDDWCGYCAYFPPRAMLFDGNLMTVQDHEIQSTDLNTCDNLYKLEVPVESSEDECCGLYFFE